VRLATHGAYRSFVEDFGLEFYPLGGDPKLLSQYIVKHRAPSPCACSGDLPARGSRGHG